MNCWAFCQFPVEDVNDRSQPLLCQQCGAEALREIGPPAHTPEQLRRWRGRMAEERSRLDGEFLAALAKSDAEWNARMRRRQEATGEDMRPFLLDRITPWLEHADGTWEQRPDGTHPRRPSGTWAYIGAGRWRRVPLEEGERQAHETDLASITAAGLRGGG
ncbi:MAG: hypothetical protein JO075_09770 [Acidimicrobiia bacterium]|nr:hypothetical protein [Acidimicrobiia bacterium]MBV8314139.1 hypothetical protein [Planctomycetaceae bacterium]